MADINRIVKKHSEMLSRNSGCATSLYTVVVAVLLVVAGCCPCKKLLRTGELVSKDSTRIETRVETRIEYKKDTFYVEIPSQTAERTTRDSTSYLENDYAESNAAIKPDGSLYHDLVTKHQKIPKEIDIPVHHRDSTATFFHAAEIPAITEVEADLTWWEITCITMFPMSLVVVAILLIIIFRRPILSFVSNLLRNLF